MLPFCIFTIMKRVTVQLIFFLFLPVILGAQEFDFNSDCKEAYREIVSLRFDHGKTLIGKEKSIHPDNQMTLVLENYIDFLQLFISEDRQLFEINENNKDLRINRIEENPSLSPEYLWSMAAIHLQWAFVRLKFGENYTAALELRKAFLLLEENNKKFPSYLPDKLLLGLLHALVGTIPDEYQWLIRLASMHGSVNQGVAEMEQVVRDCRKTDEFAYLYEEALFYLGFAKLNLLANPEDSISILTDLATADQSNLLITYLKTNIEMRIGHNEVALSTLNSRPSGNEYFPFDYLDYLKAEAMLRKLDFGAKVFYQQFILSFKGINYRQDAIRKLAWITLLEGDTKAYSEWMTLVPGQENGSVEADKQAVNEAVSVEIPDVQLLKSRLLFDGGYYAESMKVLEDSRQFLSTRNENFKLEFYYRLGRVHHVLRNFSEAMLNYQIVIESGKKSKLYYPANAALKSGEICEISNRKEEAVSFYKLCLSMQPSEYKSGIHQKAKAGLSRLTSDN
jgi:hypothetical protein